MEGKEEEEKEKKSNFQKHRVKLVLKKEMAISVCFGLPGIESIDGESPSRIRD